MGWQTPGAQEIVDLIRDINKLEPALRFNPDATVLEKLALPFYPEGVLLKALKAERFGDPLWYVRIPAEMVALDGSLANIHHLNDVAPLSLTAENILDYLKFRYYFGCKIQIFESQVKRSAVGYTGKIWGFDGGACFEADININARGMIVELERVSVPDVPKFSPGEFTL